MLILSRCIGQKIVFPGLDIEIMVVETRPGKVRLGITAPKEVVVHREEVFLKSLLNNNDNNNHKN